MTLVATASLVADAVAASRAVAAFNVITLEHAEAIAAGASRAGVGAILQLSENAVRFHGGDPRPILSACRAVAEGADVPLALHLDHVEDPALVDLAIAHASAWGLGSLMVDASRLAYADNVAATADAARRAHDAGLWVEAELGEIGGKDGAHAPGVRTDPEEAAAFVAATGVDALAVAVGSSHAMRERTAGVDAELVARIAARVPVPLVLHGSSGVDDAGIRAAVAAGIRKVNVGTALNLAGTAGLRAALAEHPDAVDPRPYTRAAREAMAGVVEHFCRVVAAP
ncbi:class II fructose-bisphosphate aldolase [Protaetiibacter mangrovi]|uniref:Class II fructose-bisphosphate aldolase n=1 Tax=Protaetiibacter mangrovi TaxID=2970926 RepID=A0ABT1ZCV8_9MICO|nr:class II fructose-bisphosphate aldolase [Protaetiibacter mangrovi]MCS0498534.1 class II fructose-bisphosphate aldolase [Protaetiibacter mangrovi]TPX04452.1 fructose-bisphosphate aldolase [Schumannella luteola]